MAVPFLLVHQDSIVPVEGKKQMHHHVNVNVLPPPPALFARSKSPTDAVKIGINIDISKFRVRGGSSVSSGSSSSDVNSKSEDVLQQDEVESVKVLSSSTSTSIAPTEDQVIEEVEENEYSVQGDEGGDEEEDVEDNERMEEREILYQKEEDTHIQVIDDERDSGDVHNPETTDDVVQEDEEEDLEENDLNEEEEADIMDSASLMGYEINDNIKEEEADVDYHEQSITQENSIGSSVDDNMSMSINDGSDANVVVDGDIADDDDNMILQNDDEVDFEDDYSDDEKTNFNESLMDDHDEENEDIGIVIDEIDNPSGSDSAAFVDRMDLADAYDDGVLTDIMGEDDTTITATPPAVTTTTTTTSTTASIHTSISDDDDKILSTPSSANTLPLPDVIQSDNRQTVQYFITENMRRCLIRQLGYSPQEVRHMKPDVAAVVVSKMLKRPKLGMPNEFYIDGTAPAIMEAKPKGNWGIRTNCIVRRIIVPTLVTGVSLYYGTTFVIGSKRNSDNGVNEYDYEKDGQRIKNYDPITTKDDSNPLDSTDLGRDIDSPATVGKTVGVPAVMHDAKPDNKKSQQINHSQKDSIENDDSLVEEKSEENELLDDLIDDSRKSLLDRIITYTLEKIDELTKRPF